MLVIRRSNCVDTASGIVFSVSDRPVCRLGRSWLGWVGVLPTDNWFLPNLHTGRSLTENTIPDAVSTQIDLLMMSTGLLETCRGL